MNKFIFLFNLKHTNYFDSRHFLDLGCYDIKGEFVFQFTCVNVKFCT